MPSHYPNPFDLGAGPGSGVMLPPQVPYAPTAAGGPMMAGQMMGAGPPGPDLSRGTIPPTTMGGIGQGIQDTASGFGDWARNQWADYRNPSDQRKKIAMALMGMGQGLLSKQPGEGFAPGLGRGIQGATQGYLQQGKRNRAERFRESVMANENIPQPIRDALAGGDPAQMQMLTSMYGTQQGAQNTQARLQAQQGAEARRTARQDKAEKVRVKERGEDRASRKERDKDEEAMNNILLAQGGNAEAMNALQQTFPGWDFETWVQNPSVLPAEAREFIKTKSTMSPMNAMMFDMFANPGGDGGGGQITRPNR